MTVTYLGVPIDSVGRAGGTEGAPVAMRGLGERFWGEDAGDLDVRVRGEDRDPVTGIAASDGVLAMTGVVASAVHALVASGAVPFVMGGCCSLLPGALAGARRAVGSLGLAYLDGHLDLYTGETSPTGEAADMAMAVLLGLGPRAWVDATNGPVLRPDQTAIVGYRDLDEALTYGHPHPDTFDGLVHLDADLVRAHGPRAVGGEVARRLHASPRRHWVHLDVDVLDETVMPATDYLMPGGLSWSELEEVMAPIVAKPGLVGVSVACYNPEKDPDGSSGRPLASMLARVVEG